MSRRAWANEELALLRARYGMHGPAVLARLLNRSSGSVSQRAHREGLQFGRVGDNLPLSAVAEAAGVSMESVRRAAKRANELRAVNAGARARHLVPAKWAERYITAAQARREAAGLIGHHYDVRQLARLFNVEPATIRSWLVGKGSGARHLTRIRRHRAPGTNGTKWLFNPYDTELVLRELRQRKKGTT